MEQDRDISLTFMKGLAVLRVFDEDRAALTLAEIARQTGLDPATARRLVLTLVRLGYVHKQGRTFSLTPRVLVLAAGFLRGQGFGTRVQPVLNRAAAGLGLGVSLALLDEDRALLVAQSTLADSAVTFGFTIGSRLPLLHTAMGRMLLAHAPQAQRQRLIAEAPLTPLTPETETDRARIAAEIASTAAQGYAVARGGFEAGVTGIAVPVGPPDDVRAVLGVSDFHARFEAEGAVLATVSTLRRAAAELAHTPPFAGASPGNGDVT
ncbi:IclR family transcriptional regulator [Sinisalibacter lacisalsi]|uniref:Transcriptional regulator n=1 Tax=Sinisalibacter lacisalsi TaxID=1526570 RepID=A0ABQ1QFW7_9RHOB|nr:IclR family transcriptional regulator C-terminal domain-containing protein [Sinisalibacter lacisalsi]GGD25368.1 transcriptional regulator [Sinisalibacter lacisalsi]